MSKRENMDVYSVSITAEAEKLGYDVEEHHASTGSVYLRLWRGGVSVTVRVADHSECYPPPRGQRRIDVSPAGVTATRAVELLSRPEDIPKCAGPAELTPEQREQLRTRGEVARRRKAEWKALRARLPEEAWRLWYKAGRNRPAARKVAALIGEGVAVTYAALTNGRSFDRRSR